MLTETFHQPSNWSRNILSYIYVIKRIINKNALNFKFGFLDFPTNFVFRLLIITLLFPGLVYEHLYTISPIKELEFRQIMEVNRNVEVIGIIHKENISKWEIIFLTCWASVTPPPSHSTTSIILCMFTKWQMDPVVRFPRLSPASNYNS